ncbi:MAG: hypothetical protein ABIQ16_28465 [Polyangiaceae bacterium]
MNELSPTRVAVFRIYSPIRLRHLLLGFALTLLTGCGSDVNDDSCMPDDQDGIVGGNNTVLLTVSDTDFAVGGVNSGSTQRNISVQNNGNVTLTLTNVGSKPHSFHVACRATDLPAGCPQTSCFPDIATVPAIEPGDSVTVMFQTPAVEGEYQFTSDEPGDEDLLGQFVLI